MSYIIFGRAIKNEYLTLGTIFSAGGIAWALKSGGKKEPVAHSSGQSLVEKVKEAVPINAGSNEEEDFISQYIAQAEKETKH